MADQNVNLNVQGNFVDNISPALSQLTTGGIGTLTTALGGLAAAFSVASISSFVNEAINAGDALDELAQKTGTAVEEISAMSLSAQVEGMGVEGLANSYKFLSKSLVEAQNVSSDAAYAFKSLGIATQDSEGNVRNVQEVFLELADVFQRTENDAFKVSASMKLMGKSGVDMIPMLNNGAEAIREMNKAGEEFGLNWGTEQAAQAAEFNDNINILRGSVDGFWQIIAKELLPAFVAMAKYMADSAREGGVLRAVMDSLAQVVVALFVPFKALADVIAIITASFNIAGKSIGGFMAAAEAAMSMDFEGVKTIMKDTASDISKIVTDYEGFSDRLWSNKGTETPDSAAVKETKQSVGDLGAAEKKRAEEAEKANEKAAKAQERLNDNYEKAVGALSRQLFAINNSGKTAEVAWNNAFGEYANFSDKQKETLLGLAKEIDLQTQLTAITNNRMQLADKLFALNQNAVQGAEHALIEPRAMREAATLIDDYVNSVHNWELTEQRRIDKISDANLKQEEMKTLNEEVARLLSGETLEAYKKNAEAIAELNQKTEIYTETILKNRDAHTDLAKESELLVEWKQKGMITEEEYIGASEKNLRKQQELWKNQTESNRRYYDLIQSDVETRKELIKDQDMLNQALQKGDITLAQYNEKMKNLNDQMRNLDSEYAVDQIEKMDSAIKNATGAFEGMFSDYIFEGMQGNWQDLGDMTKKIIDRMVADMIAAQLQMMLFGDIAETPSGKTPKSTGALGGIFSGIFGGSTSAGGTSAPSGGMGSGGGFWSGIGDFFGGFFAEGGDVNPNKFYVVGEKGPELFSPKSAGTIIPNENLGGSNSVSINITAMDGADVMRVLSGRKREIAEMLTQTNRTYNLGV
jgi:hypothetical protein